MKANTLFLLTALLGGVRARPFEEAAGPVSNPEGLEEPSEAELDIDHLVEIGSPGDEKRDVVVFSPTATPSLKDFLKAWEFVEENPTSTHKGKPTVTGKGKPTVTGKGKGKPTVTGKGKGKPTVTGKGKPTATGKGKPTVTRKGKPTGPRKGKPTITHEGKPTITHQGKPTGTHIKPIFPRQLTHPTTTHTGESKECPRHTHTNKFIYTSVPDPYRNPYPYPYDPEYEYQLPTVATLSKPCTKVFHQTPTSPPRGQPVSTTTPSGVKPPTPVAAGNHTCGPQCPHHVPVVPVSGSIVNPAVSGVTFLAVALAGLLLL